MTKKFMHKIFVIAVLAILGTPSFAYRERPTILAPGFEKCASEIAQTGAEEPLTFTIFLESIQIIKHLHTKHPRRYSFEIIVELKSSTVMPMHRLLVGVLRGFDVDCIPKYIAQHGLHHVTVLFSHPNMHVIAAFRPTKIEHIEGNKFRILLSAATARAHINALMMLEKKHTARAPVLLRFIDLEVHHAVGEKHEEPKETPSIFFPYASRGLTMQKHDNGDWTLILKDVTQISELFLNGSENPYYKSVPFKSMIKPGFKPTISFVVEKYDEPEILQMYVKKAHRIVGTQDIQLEVSSLLEESFLVHLTDETNEFLTTHRPISLYVELQR